MERQWKSGDIFTLGCYPQLNPDTWEPIEWRILKITGRLAFVTSIFALDAQPYNEKSPDQSVDNKKANNNPVSPLSVFMEPGFSDVTWENCTLRNWLKQSFLNAAFSREEQECLSEVDDLKDKVSLLALDEHINDPGLFPTDASTGCQATPYAASLYTDDIELDRQERAVMPIPSRASYWLKNKGIVIHGDEMKGVAGVTCGRLKLSGKLAVRPVLVVNLDLLDSLFNSRAEKYAEDDRPKANQEEEKTGTIYIDDQNFRIIVNGVRNPDLHMEIPFHGQLDEAKRNGLALGLIQAIQGDAKFQHSIDTMFWNGNIFNQDFREAAKWYQYAANQGLPEAMVDLADAYINEKGKEKNTEKAFSLCLQAAKKGYPLGMLNAGKCYQYGWGTDKNIEEAIAWYEKAADSGNEEAASLRNSLSKAAALQEAIMKALDSQKTQAEPDDPEKIISKVIQSADTSAEISAPQETNIVTESGECGPDLIWTLSDKGVLHICKNVKAGNGVDPAADDGAMYNYGYNPFHKNNIWSPWKKNEHIEKVIINDGVTSIGNGAFIGCSNLRSITIPDSVQYIGISAFSGCKSLADIDIPEGIRQIRQETFQSCKSLERVNIPESVEEIEKDAFLGCSGLTNVRIPQNVTYIGSGAFSNCSSLTEITLPDGLTEIESGTFSSCTNLKTINIPDSITRIGRGAFAKTSWMDSQDRFVIVNNILIEYKGNEETVRIPDGVICIGDAAFAQSPIVANVIIPDSVTDIGKYAFERCAQLEQIIIPDSVTNIGDEAFVFCKTLSKVKLPNKLTCISKALFLGCENITEIVIPETVTFIGNSAFQRCKKLKKVSLPENLAEIGSDAFNDCEQLSDLVIPEKVNSIRKSAFIKTPWIAKQKEFEDVNDTLIRKKKEFHNNTGSDSENTVSEKHHDDITINKPQTDGEKVLKNNTDKTDANPQKNRKLIISLCAVGLLILAYVIVHYFCVTLPGYIKSGDEALAEHNYSKAIEFYEKAEGNEDDEDREHVIAAKKEWANAKKDEGDFAGAIELLEDAFDSDSADQVRHDWAAAKLEQGEFKDAIELLIQAQDLDGANETRQIWAGILEEKGEYEDAIEQLLLANDEQAVETLRLKWSDELKEKGNYEQAIALLRQTKDWDSVLQTARGWADELSSEYKYGEAVAILSYINDFEGTNRIKSEWANAKRDDGDYEGAAELFAEISDQTKLSETYRLWSNSLESEKNYGEAITILSHSAQTKKRDIRISELSALYADELVADVLSHDGETGMKDYEYARNAGARLFDLSAQLKFCKSLSEMEYDLGDLYPDGVEVMNVPLEEYWITNLNAYEFLDDGSYETDTLNLSKVIVFERQEILEDQVVATGFLSGVEYKRSFIIKLLPAEMTAFDIPDSLNDASAILIKDYIYLKGGEVSQEIDNNSFQSMVDMISAQSSSQKYPFYYAVCGLFAFDTLDPQVGQILLYKATAPKVTDNDWFDKNKTNSSVTLRENLIAEWDDTFFQNGISDIILTLQ